MRNGPNYQVHKYPTTNAVRSTYEGVINTMATGITSTHSNIKGYKGPLRNCNT